MLAFLTYIKFLYLDFLGCHSEQAVVAVKNLQFPTRSSCLNVENTTIKLDE